MDESIDGELIDGQLPIAPGITIPRAELCFRTSRSSGPGGQHVNKTETRVELLFDLAHTPSLTDEQRALALAALQNRVDADGELRIVVEQHRSQYRNREEAIVRFVNLLQHAFRPRKTRRPTKIPRSVQENRLERKKQRSGIKRLRGKGRGYED